MGRGSSRHWPTHRVVRHPISHPCLPLACPFPSYPRPQAACPRVPPLFLLPSLAKLRRRRRKSVPQKLEELGGGGREAVRRVRLFPHSVMSEGESAPGQNQ